MTPESCIYSNCSQTVVNSVERVLDASVCLCVFVYSLQASWKHSILTPHMHLYHLPDVFVQSFDL